MNHKGFHYQVEAVCLFSGAELWLLFQGAKQHYDGRCRAAAKPSQQVGWGGEIWGLMNRFCTDQVSMNETSEQFFERNCRERPNDILEIELPSRTLDLLSKCVEFDPDVPGLRSLRQGMREAHRAIVREYVSQNKLEKGILADSVARDDDPLYENLPPLNKV